MTSTLDGLISKARKLAVVGDGEAAMSLADELVKRHPTDVNVWSLRGHLLARIGHYREAISDLSEAIVMEPSLFFNRGRYHLELQDYDRAIDDFGRGLVICDHYDDDYYRGALHSLRAEAFVQLGRKTEALADLSQVREDMKMWTDRLRSKADLAAECSQLP